MNRILAVTPHPDDETLGCGGTLLKHKEKGDEIYWLIVSSMHREDGFSDEAIDRRSKEIAAVSKEYQFSECFELGFPTIRLEQVPLGSIIGAISKCLHQVQANICYLPFPGDSHSDHKVCFAAASACMKSFRAPFVRKILAYETISETDSAIDPTVQAFTPTVFVDVEKFLDRKIEIMGIYAGKMGEFPFPRSREALVAQARGRGTSSGHKASEAFMLLREYA